MNKYVLKFRKEGYIKYTSHLDLIRLFHRAFKMAGLKLDYSIGFNPHPKMSFIQPLSLGYSSRAELLEFELKESVDFQFIILSLNEKLPDGISIIDVTNYELNKPLAGFVESCEYNIYFPISYSEEDFETILTKYLNENNLIVSKRTKKGDYKDIDIKPMIRKYSISKLGDYLVLNTILDSGSNSNLSPELLLNGLLNYSIVKIERSNIEIERTSISFSNNFQF